MARGILGQQEAPITTPAAIYTAGTGVETTQMTMMVANHTGTDYWLTIYVAQDGSAAADDHLIYYQNDVVAGETDTFSLPPMTGGGGKVYVVAEAATSLACTLYGTERLP